MSDSDPWGEQWQRAQRQFVDAWSQMASFDPANGSTGPAELWAEGFQRWRKAAGGEGQPEIRGAIDKCLAMGKAYFALAEQLGITPEADASPLQAIDRWLADLAKTMRGMAAAPGFDSDAIGDFLRPWFNPGDAWQQMANTMGLGGSPLPDLLGMNAGTFNFGDSVDPLGKLLETPGVGYFRETQEKQQKTAQLVLEYQQANQRFNQAFLGVAIESLDAFRRRLAALGDDEQPESLRAIYDLWVEVSEQCYARFAMSDDYPRLYGDRVNRLMALRIHLNRLTDELMAKVNLPGSREIETMQQRLQQLRRDNLELRQAVGEIRSALDGAPAAAGKRRASAKQATAGNKAGRGKPRAGGGDRES